jgi:hypothetical protein
MRGPVHREDIKHDHLACRELDIPRQGLIEFIRRQGAPDDQIVAIDKDMLTDPFRLVRAGDDTQAAILRGAVGGRDPYARR